MSDVPGEALSPLGHHKVIFCQGNDAYVFSDDGSVTRDIFLSFYAGNLLFIDAERRMESCPKLDPLCVTGG